MTPVATDTGAVQELLALRPGVYSGRSADGRSYLVGWPAGEQLGGSTPELRAVLARLAGEPVTGEQLCQDTPDHHCSKTMPPCPVQRLLERLRAGGWLTVTTTFQGHPTHRVVPYDRPDRAPAPQLPRAAMLSRFTLCYRSESQLVLDSPRSWCTVEVHDPGLLPVVGELVEPLGAQAWESRPAAARFVRDLWSAGMLIAADGQAENEFRHRQWAPHELWFHERSRIRRRAPGDRYGATWWARGSFPPLPARAAGFPGPRVALARPDLDQLRRTDPPVSQVLEDRMSVRRHDDDRPIGRDQLAELLYRTARNRRIRVEDRVEYVGKPYPTGGGGGELELYPVVRCVAGLAPGMYHYDPDAHELERVCHAGTATRRLLRLAAMSADSLPEQPQVLLVISARFGRMMWKYEEMPYSVTLKHVGVLYQMLYTVATAMNLAACGLGVGDAATFADATGLDPLEESSVGEFMLGSRPAAVPPSETGAA